MLGRALEDQEGPRQRMRWQCQAEVHMPGWGQGMVHMVKEKEHGRGCVILGAGGVEVFRGGEAGANRESRPHGGGGTRARRGELAGPV